MCSRYALKASTVVQLCQLLGISLDQTPTTDRYNVAPATPVVALRGNEATTLRWGLIPHWSQPGRAPGAPLTNARAETVAEKPSFRDPWQRRQRCVLPATGFYEWEKRGRERLPSLFQHRDNQPLAMAGLWDRWTDPNDGSIIESCTVITTTPNPLLARIHDRMPVLLDAPAARAWLQADTHATSALQPYPAEHMRETLLDARVNTTAHDDAACWTPRGEAPGTQFDLF